LSLVPGWYLKNAHFELPAGEAHRDGCGKENFTPAETGEAAPEREGPLKFSRRRPMSAAGKSWRELLPAGRGRFALLLSVQK